MGTIHLSNSGMRAAESPVPTLRVATADDAVCIGVLATQVFLDTYATHGINRSIAREVLTLLSTPAVAALLAARGERFIVAESADRMVGFAQLRLGAGHDRVEAGRPAEVVRLYVQEAFAGRGIGTTLLAAVEALAASSGATHAWLTAWVGNPRALAFYPRRGYAELGSTPYTFEGEHHENRLFAKPLVTDDPGTAHE